MHTYLRTCVPFLEAKHEPNFIFLSFCLLTFTGFSGEGGAGHWFHILFVIVPIGFILYLLNKKIDDISESLFKIEAQIYKLTSKLEKNDKKK